MNQENLEIPTVNNRGIKRRGIVKIFSSVLTISAVLVAFFSGAVGGVVGGRGCRPVFREKGIFR